VVDHPAWPPPRFEFRRRNLVSPANALMRDPWTLR
jgi:hypothetical protein